MAFNVPISSQPPLPTPSDWVRPSDWISITDTTNEVQFLVSDQGLKAFAIQTTFIKNSSTNIYIDWGDGTVNTISTISDTITNHVYSTGGTPCSRGYNTFKIRIYGDATCVITNVKHVSNFDVTGGTTCYNISVLEAYFGNNTMNAITISPFSSNGALQSTASVASFSDLEYVKLPATVTWTDSMSYMFNNCTSLYKVIMPTSASALTSLSSAFYGCTNLLDITFPANSISITGLTTAFYGCINLRTVSFPTTLNRCTTFNTAFRDCYSLKNITFPSINSCTDISSALSTCPSLQWVKFTSLPIPISAGTAVSFAFTFNGCTSLQNVYFPSTCSSNAIYSLLSAFVNCYNFKNITFPTNFNASSLSSAFSSCFSLTNATFPSSMPNLTNMDTAFYNCYLLRSVQLPTTVGGGISLGTAGGSGTFGSCFALSSITIPSGWNITSLSNAFQNCRNLKTIVLPNNTQNSITSMLYMCQGCSKLESITMPTSLNLVNTLQSAFESCYNLQTVSFPASMPALTTLSAAFSSCQSLISLTLPTTTPVLSQMYQTFIYCFKIIEITLPSTVGGIAVFQQTFQGCNSLKTITLPTTQMSSVYSCQNLLYQCAVLTTINNLSKLGTLAATPLVDGTKFEYQTYGITSLSFNCPFSKLELNGLGSNSFNKLNSLRLLNTGTGQWTGTSPQLNVSYCYLGIAALNQLFTDLTTVTSKTINIAGCTGAAGCTRSIATAKGWTVIG